MDKLKYIKLENEDGSYTSLIPLAVDSDYVDVNGNTLTNELANKATKTEVQAVASGSPLVASSTSEMTNTSKIYVNTTDGHWYWYDGDSWEDGGVYQATEDSDSVDDLNKIVIDNSIFDENISYSGFEINKECELKAFKNQYLKLTITDSNDIIKPQGYCRITYKKTDGTYTNENDINRYLVHLLPYKLLKVPEDCTAIKISFWQSHFQSQGQFNIKIENANKSDARHLANLDMSNIDKKLYNNVYEFSGSVKIAASNYFVFPFYIPRNTNFKVTFLSTGVSNVSFGYFKEGQTTQTFIKNLTPDVASNIDLQYDCEYLALSINSANITTDNSNFTLKIELLEGKGIYQIIDKLVHTDVLKGKYPSVSILGDSYSTFIGFIRLNNAYWYDGTKNGIDTAKKTWWWKVCEELKASLLVNDSYSGSTICNTGYSGADYSDRSFVSRMRWGMGEGKASQSKPNLIFILGGTNDDWADSPIGSLQYSGWTENDLKNVLPAFCYMLDYLLYWNPGVRIVNLINEGLDNDISDGMISACEHYNVDCIALSNISKIDGHPDESGMESIKDQIINYLKEHND